MSLEEAPVLFLFRKHLAALSRSNQWPSHKINRNYKVVQSISSGQVQMSILDTNGNNDEVNIVTMDVQFSWRSVCVYIGGVS